MSSDNGSKNGKLFFGEDDCHRKFFLMVPSKTKIESFAKLYHIGELGGKVLRGKKKTLHIRKMRKRS